MWASNDRSYCLYNRIGACHSRCSHPHNAPKISRTLILPQMYQRPDMVIPGVDPQGQQPIDPKKLQDHFEDFYEDIYEELSVFGEIENLTVCDNFAEHMIGNVYVMFKEEQQAAAALEVFRRRAYCGRPIVVEFSPVRDFGRALCKDNKCIRKYCKYMHVKKIGRGMSKKLFGKCSSRHVRSLSPHYPYRAQSEGRRDHGDYYGHSHRNADRHGRYDDERGRRQYRTRSPVRETSVERRAKIERWNRERERERSVQILKY
ncbi:hypothetical protein ACHQM5_025384 [Ranunculus cassubicifolius]